MGSNSSILRRLRILPLLIQRPPLCTVVMMPRARLVATPLIAIALRSSEVFLASARMADVFAFFASTLRSAGDIAAKRALPALRARALRSEEVLFALIIATPFRPFSLNCTAVSLPNPLLNASRRSSGVTRSLYDSVRIMPDCRFCSEVRLAVDAKPPLRPICRRRSGDWLTRSDLIRSAFNLGSLPGASEPFKAASRRSIGVIVALARRAIALRSSGVFRA